MEKCIVLALFAMALHGPSLSACRVYSLQSPCTVAFSDSRKSVHANRVEIAATEGADGRVSSPFKVCGYDKDGKLTYNAVFGVNYASTSGVPEVLLLDVPGKVAVHREVVRDGISIGDSHFRISARKPGNEFLVVVEKLDLQRLEAGMEAQVARMRANGFADSPATWPPMDDGRRYRCSRSEFFGIPQAGDGGSSVAAGLRLKGALYQKGDEVSVRFALSRERIQSLEGKAKGDGETIAEGRIVFKIANGEIKNSVVTYDSGEGSVEASVSLPHRNETRMSEPGFAALQKALENRGAKERPVRLNLAYGAAKTMIDLDME